MPNPRGMGGTTVSPVADPDILIVSGMDQAVGDAQIIMDRRPSQPINFSPGKRRNSKRKRSKKEMRKIRDNENRELRRLSKAPSVGFIVEEGLLEDLCEI